MPRATRRKYRKKSKTRRVKKKKRVVKRKRRTKSKKRVAKSKRRVKLINKTIKRVQAKLADDVVVMRRMYRKTQVGTTGSDVSTLDIRDQIRDGQLILNKYVGLPVTYSDWWQINDFHGANRPRYNYLADKVGHLDSYTAVDRDWETKKPWDNHTDMYPQDHITGLGLPGVGENFIEGVVDILAYTQKEIPFLPCVPRHVELINNGGIYSSRLNQFARKGDRIKVRSNYMRFNFYVQPGMQYCKPVFAGRDEYEEQLPPEIPGGPSQVRGLGGVVKEWTIAARSMAKARIIVVKRSGDAHDNPINLNDFLKDNDPYLMGDEKYRMNKYFNRKYKTDNDIIVQPFSTGMVHTQEPNHADVKKLQYQVTKLKDLSNETQRSLHNVQIMYDKVHSLRVGGETVVKLSLMKGTTLKYEEQNPAHTEIYTSKTGTTLTNVNNQLADPEIRTAAGYNDALPVSTNDILRRRFKHDPPSNDNGQPPTVVTPEVQAARNEYVPTGAKYAAFILLMNQKCSTEYQIYQKFEFDN